MLHHPLDHGGPGHRKLQPDHQPQHAKLLHNGQLVHQRLQQLPELVAELPGAVEQAFLLDCLQRGHPGRSRQRIAAECSRMHAGAEAAGQLRPGEHSSGCHPAAKPLGQRDYVWFHAEVLIAEPVSGAATAGLHLVENQNQLVFVGNLAQALQKALGRDAHPAFALNRLHQNGGRLVVHQGFHRVGIAEGGVGEPGQKRPQPFVILRLGGGCGGGQRAAVEPALEGNHLVAVRAAVEPHQFQRRLVGFGSRVAKERLAAEAPLRKHLRPAPLRFDVPGVGHVDQPSHLLLHGLHHPRRAMAQQVASPAGEQVQVASALGIPDPGPFAPDQRHRIAHVVGNHVLVEQGDYRIGGRGAHRRVLRRIRGGGMFRRTGNAQGPVASASGTICVPTPRSV